MKKIEAANDKKLQRSEMKYLNFEQEYKKERGEWNRQLNEAMEKLNRPKKSQGVLCLMDAEEDDREAEAEIITKRKDVMDKINENYTRLKDTIQNKLRDHWDVKVFGNMMLDEILELAKELSDDFQYY